MKKRKFDHKNKDFIKALDLDINDLKEIDKLTEKFGKEISSFGAENISLSKAIENTAKEIEKKDVINVSCTFWNIITIITNNLAQFMNLSSYPTNNKEIN